MIKMNHLKRVLVVSSLAIFLSVGIINASELKAKLEVRDLDTLNSPLSGFSYKVLDANSKSSVLKKTKAGVHEIELPIGRYTLVEIETKNGYQKSSNLDFDLIEDGLVLYPKHKDIKKYKHEKDTKEDVIEQPENKKKVIEQPINKQKLIEQPKNKHKVAKTGETDIISGLGLLLTVGSILHTALKKR